jgi:DHA1 family inner membrane transport protein
VAAVADWRTTLIAVAVLGLVAFAGVAAGMPAMPGVPSAGLRTRLAPVRDRRVAAILATTLLAYAGLFSAYSYIAVVLHPITGGDGTELAELLFVWGIAATVGNLGAGHLSDRFGGCRTAVGALLVVAVDFLFLRWSSTHLPTALPALVIWGLAGWGLLVAQQHRLVGVAPPAAPLVIALNSSATYIAVSASGAIGAAVIGTAGASWLGPVAVVFLLAALLATAPPLYRAPALASDGARGGERGVT